MSRAALAGWIASFLGLFALCGCRRSPPVCGAAGSSCFEVGSRYERGDGVTADLAVASQLFDKGCTLGETDSCRALGRLYEREGRTLVGRDLGSEGDAFLASPQSLYEAECSQGAIGACEVLGDFFHLGEAGTPVDETKSNFYYGRACEGGSTTACKKVGRRSGSGSVSASGSGSAPGTG